MKPFFSIIIPVYNVAPYLRECLDSVLHQTFENWEAICVDDGSTDGSGDILDEYAVRDSRFHVIHKENGGVSSARNAALDVAQGEWILFLDGDDLFRLETLALLKQRIERNNDADLISFKLQRFEGETCNWSLSAESQDEVIDLREMLSTAELFSGFSAKVYRGRLVAKIRFRSFKRGEDVLFLSEFLDRADNAVRIDEYLYGYRQRSDSATKANYSCSDIAANISCMEEILNVYNRMRKKISNRRISELFCTLASQYLLLICAVPARDRSYLWCVWYDAITAIGQKQQIFNGLTFFQRKFIQLNSRIKRPGIALISAIPLGTNLFIKTSLLWSLIKCRGFGRCAFR